MATQLYAATRSILLRSKRQALCANNLAKARTTGCHQHDPRQNPGSLLRHIALHAPVLLAIETAQAMYHTGKSRLSLNDDSQQSGHYIIGKLQDIA